MRGRIGFFNRGKSLEEGRHRVYIDSTPIFSGYSYRRDVTFDGNLQTDRGFQEVEHFIGVEETLTEFKERGMLRARGSFYTGKKKTYLRLRAEMLDGAEYQLAFNFRDYYDPNVEIKRLR